MSDFRFARPALPRRAVLGLGQAAVLLATALALLLAAGAERRQEAVAEMRALVARAEATGGDPLARLGASAFYAAETPQLAQAALQTDLQALAAAHSIELEVIRADEIARAEGLVRLNLTLTGAAPEPELGRFLQALAAHRPIVLVETLTLRPAREGRLSEVRRVAFEARLSGVSRP